MTTAVQAAPAPNRVQALERTTEAIRELSADQWRNSLEIGRQLQEMLENELWKENPEVVAYAEKASQTKGSKQNPPGHEALTARHLKSQGLDYTSVRVYHLSQAASLVAHLDGLTHVRPSSEGQIRPLVAFKDLESGQLAVLWAEAVQLAGEEQPTAAEVRAIVHKHYPPQPRRRKPLKDVLRRDFKGYTKKQIVEAMRQLLEEEADAVITVGSARKR